MRGAAIPLRSEDPGYPCRRLMNVEESKEWQLFWRGDLHALMIDPRGEVLTQRPSCIGLLPGSFNPLHEAHTGLAGAASRILNKEIFFELSVSNVDKSMIDH